jgi:hypothetical protein
MAPTERTKVENCLFIGCCYGSKPEMNLFLSDFVKDMLILEEGVMMRINNEEITLRARIVGNVFDLPVRSAVYCMRGYNGAYGCSWSNNKGKSINRRYCYPFNNYDKHRSVESIKVAYAKLSKASDPEAVIDGIKDRSVLIILPYWNIVDMDVLDGMHLVQGIVKHLCSLWSKPKFKTYAFNWLKKDWTISTIFTNIRRI